MIAPPKKILIVLFGAIGDVCRALPLAVRIKSAWPATELHWAVEPKSVGLLEQHPAVDHIQLFNRPRGIAEYLRFVRRLRVEEYQIVLDLQRHFKSGVTSALTGAVQRVGFNRRNAKEFNWLFSTETIPAVKNMSAKIEHYQLFGDQLGIPRKTVLEFGLPATSSMTTEVAKKLDNVAGQKLVAVILGSSWPSRLWPATHYASLIRDCIQELKLIPVLIGAAAERSVRDEIMTLLSREDADSVVDLVGQCALNELSVVLASVCCAVGPDSGPMHIAAAVGAPVVSLWGATSPVRSAPYGSEDHVICANLSCTPCYKRICPGLGTLCMASIPAVAVKAKIAEISRSPAT